MGPRCPERLASSLGHTASCGGDRIIAQNTQAHHHEPTKVSVQKKPAGVLGFRWWGSNKSILLLLHITHSTSSSKMRIVNVTGSVKRQQRKNKARGREKPRSCGEFLVTFIPLPGPPPFAKVTVPEWGTSATRGSPCAYVGLEVRAARGTGLSLSAYHGVGAVAPQRRGEAHVAHREPGDPATHHVAAHPELPGPPPPLRTLRAVGGAEPGPAGADWPRGRAQELDLTRVTGRVPNSPRRSSCSWRICSPVLSRTSLARIRSTSRWTKTRGVAPRCVGVLAGTFPAWTGNSPSNLPGNGVLEEGAGSEQSSIAP